MSAALSKVRISLDFTGHSYKRQGSPYGENAWRGQRSPYEENWWEQIRSSVAWRSVIIFSTIKFFYSADSFWFSLNQRRLRIPLTNNPGSVTVNECVYKEWLRVPVELSSVARKHNQYKSEKIQFPLHLHFDVLSSTFSPIHLFPWF